MYTAKRYDDLLQSPITRFTVHQFHNYVKSMSVQDVQDKSVVLVHRLTDQVLHVHRLILAYWEDCGKVIAWLNTGAHWLSPWACPVDTLHMHLLGETHGYITI